MLKQMIHFLKKTWRAGLLGLVLAVSGASCAITNNAAPSGGASAPIAVEVPMIVPTSIGVGAGLVGSANVSSPLNKSIMMSVSPSTLLDINADTDAVTTILNEILDTTLASVFEDNGDAIELRSSVDKHSATVTKSDGTILYFDYKAFTFTPFTTTDPVGINAGSQTCSGNNANPAVTGRAICMRVWKLSPGQVVTASTDLRFMEALFTIKPTATTDGAGSFHVISSYGGNPFLGGYSYNRDGGNQEIFANIYANNPSIDWEALGDRMYVSDEPDETGTTLHYLNKGGFQSGNAGLMTSIFYDGGAYLRENLKQTGTGGTEEAVLRNACVNRTTGVQDVSGESCTGIPAITDGFFDSAAPSDYTFQADFFLQPPNGIDPTN